MSITAEAPNGVRHYLFLAPLPATPASGSYVEDNHARAMIMLGCPWQSWLPPKRDGSLEPDDLSHIGYGYRADVFDPGTPADPNVRVLVSSPFYPNGLGELHDSPVLFSIDRQTSWLLVVNNAGVFSAVAAPLQAARFDFLPIYNDLTETEDVLTVNNAGTFSVSIMGESYLTRSVVLARGGAVYIPDGRFPAPIGSSQSGISYGHI